MLWLELTFQDLRILNGRGVDSNLHPKISIGTPSLMNLEVMKSVISMIERKEKWSLSW